MKLLRDFESGLGTVVEGTFGAVFRSPVQPAELARAAAKEMTRSRKLGLGKMHVSNVYFIFISPRDGESMGDLAPTIEGELESHLLAFARERDYSFVTRPVVRFSVDEALKRQGKFDVIGQQMSAEAIYAELGHVPGVTDEIEAVQHRAAPAPTPARVEAEQMPELQLNDPPPTALPFTPPADSWGAAAPLSTDADFEGGRPPTAVLAGGAAAIPATPAAAPATPPAKPSITRIGSLVMPDQGEVELDPGRSYITGRQSSCDLPVADANISRQHAEFFWDGEGWSLRDLGSTNGTSVNDQKVSGAIELHDGDHITLGISRLIYHETSRMA
ncbi:MAG: FHA domain-containing protein [Coriobacteriia bacterium]|nr:FHA domain-containing protein [Coriobacteriia bacterium]